MCRANRVYESSQVQYDRCSCVKQYFSAAVPGPSLQSQSLGAKLALPETGPVTLRKKAKMSGIKLTKNMLNDDQSKNPSLMRCKPFVQSQLAEQPKIQILASNKIPTYLPTKSKNRFQNYLEGNHNVNFTESHLLHPFEENPVAGLCEAGAKNTRSFMKETALFSDNVSFHGFSHQIPICTKINSTSSTTLFETKKNPEQICIKQIQNLLRMDHHHEKQHQTKPVTQIHSLNKIDFSRVRQVQTVMSSDSFSISFLDVGSLHEEDSNSSSPHTQIQQQLLKILKN